MNLHALAIPDDPAELPSWLEAHLLGLDLAALVAELSVVHGASPEPAAALQDILGGQLDEVLTAGLLTLPPSILRQLLLQPRLLLELQDLVVTAGGPYWDQVARPTAELDRQLGRGRQWLHDFLRAEEPPGRQILSLSAAVAWYRRPWVVSLATAASVLLAVGIYQRWTPPPSAPVVLAPAPAGWGWNKPDALPEKVPADAYLNQLADAAEEWFKRRPEEPAALAKRLAEFRQGCSMLLLAKHTPLPVEDRNWLVERCQLWARKLDTHLAAVESGRAPLEVRAEADETINQLIAALRKRALG